MNLEEELWQHICKAYLNEEDAKTMDRNCDLIAEGIIDSLALMGLISHIEKTYQIKVGDDEVVKENFSSLPRLVHFVTKKRA